MSSENKTLTRAELYEKVWTTPMRTLAKEFGLSDVGLAKLCRRYHIPTPGLGHWRLVETGHPPKQVPLPPMQSPGSENVVIPTREPRPYELPQKSELPPIPKIEVKEDREITHPIAIRTRKAFEPTSKDDKGWFVPHNLKAPHLRVSKLSAPRAFRIFDALFFALEAKGYSVDWSKEPDSRPHVLVDGERISFSLAETFSRKPHALTRAETERKSKNLYVYAPQWDYAPSGILRLSFEGLPYELKHIRKSWGDGSAQRLEDCLADFVAILPHLAKALKVVAEEAERKQKQWQEEQRKREEERRQREEYDRKLKVVNQFLDFWNRSKTFHDLASSIEVKLEDPAIPDNQRADLREISTWIFRHAENCNPIAHLDWMIRKFNESQSPWKY